MSLPKDDAALLSARWSEGVLLKRDVFSNVERGRFRRESGEIDAVLRRLDEVPWWSFLLAHHLFTRERKALALAKGLDVGPELIWAGRGALVRGFIDGVALHLAKPRGNIAYFRSAKQALRRLHRAGITHNDLAKEQNWLVGRDGRLRVEIGAEKYGTKAQYRWRSEVALLDIVPLRDDHVRPGRILGLQHRLSFAKARTFSGVRPRCTGRRLGSCRNGVASSSSRYGLAPPAPGAR